MTQFSFRQLLRSPLQLPEKGAVLDFADHVVGQLNAGFFRAPLFKDRFSEGGSDVWSVDAPIEPDWYDSSWAPKRLASLFFSPAKRARFEVVLHRETKKPCMMFLCVDNYTWNGNMDHPIASIGFVIRSDALGWSVKLSEFPAPLSRPDPHGLIWLLDWGRQMFSPHPSPVLGKYPKGFKPGRFDYN